METLRKLSPRFLLVLLSFLIHLLFYLLIVLIVLANTTNRLTCK